MSTKHFLLPLLSLFLLCTGVRAQPPQAAPVGNVSVDVPAKVTTLMNLWQDGNEAETELDGWRVQLLATPDRQRLEAVEADFKMNYPSVRVDWVHESPYYKLRAGAFRTKQEAERLKYTLGRQFEGVYLVKDKIKESELVRQ